MLKNRLYLVITFSAMVTLFEIIHHSLSGDMFFNETEFWIEVVFYAIFLPGSGLVILGLVERYQQERNQAIQILDQELKLTRELSKQMPWELLIDTIVQLPTQVVPACSTYLHLYDPEQGTFNRLGFWRSDLGEAEGLASILQHYECSCGFIQSPYAELHQCHTHPTGKDGNRLRFCLSLVHGGKLVGLLHLDLPQNTLINKEQERVLVGIASDMAWALDNARLERTTSDQAVELSNFRSQIAKELHDTLAQNISYLRLTLDRLVSETGFDDIDAVRRQVANMHRTAEEAYGQVRNALDSLQQVASPDLLTDLVTQANKIKERSNLEIKLTTQGDPITVYPDAQRQILYICREIFNNIEKHANAKSVSITVHWHPECLLITIHDDGVGFQQPMGGGFPYEDGHYGFKIMRERVQELRGTLSLDSRPGAGTRITLQVPLEMINSGIQINDPTN